MAEPKKFLPYGLHWIDEDDIQEVVEILKSDWITTGPKIKEFEDAVCGYIGCKYGVAVNSGTSALDIAVASTGIEKGCEVITTPFTFVATSNAILYNNHRPVFADIQKDTFNINPDEIRKKITEKTKAIIYVDYAGHPCEIDEIREIAEDYELYLIEDACHALGAEYKGKKIGNFADISVFSFHPVKHITTGEGGMCVTDNEELTAKMRMLRNHGIDKDVQERFGPKAGYAYDLKYLGRNYRMTDFQAALGIAQLKKIEGFIKNRQEIARKYNEAFKDFKWITPQHCKSFVRHVWHIYPVLLNGMERDKFFNAMRRRNIGVNVHYIPIYKFNYYHEFNISPDKFPNTEDVFSRTVTLPLYSKMMNAEVDYVIKSVKSIMET